MVKLEDIRDDIAKLAEVVTQNSKEVEQNSKDISRNGFLLERLQEDVSRLGESLDGTHQTVTRLEDKLDRVATQAADIPVIKAAVIDQTEHMVAQDERISRLEAAA